MRVNLSLVKSLSVLGTKLSGINWVGTNLLVLRAFSSHAKILSVGSTNHFPSPRWFFVVVVFFSGDHFAHSNFTFKAVISPEWLSELRRLWMGFS